MECMLFLNISLLAMQAINHNPIYISNLIILRPAIHYCQLIFISLFIFLFILANLMMKKWMFPDYY